MMEDENENGRRAPDDRAQREARSLNPSLGRLRQNLERVRAEVASAAGRAGRISRDVTVLAVTKYVDATIIRGLHAIGVQDFGESRVQRVVALSRDLCDLDLRWHLVGHLQRNKARRAIELCATIHSIDSPRLADELAKLSAVTDEPAGVYVEVNIAAEERKTGLAEDDLPRVLECLGDAANLRVLGLMGMAPFAADPELARPHFRHLAALRDREVSAGRLPPGAGLSMGMSRDFGVAIEEGATVIRVGRGLFEGIDVPPR